MLLALAHTDCCYRADYELAKLLRFLDDPAGARSHLDLVASGKHLEGPSYTRKGKYSMEVRRPVLLS